MAPTQQIPSDFSPRCSSLIRSLFLFFFIPKNLLFILFINLHQSVNKFFVVQTENIANGRNEDKR